jgi:hypothetical protein
VIKEVGAQVRVGRRASFCLVLMTHHEQGHRTEPPSLSMVFGLRPVNLMPV